MQTESLLGLINNGGFTVYILIICSIISFAVILEKLIYYRILDPKFNELFIYKFVSLLKSGKYDEAKLYIQNNNKTIFGTKIVSPLSYVFIYILENKTLNRESLMQNAFTQMDKRLSNIEKGLGILATLGSITPFIGLFGTVIGIIKSFSALSNTDPSGYASVMGGISEALISTAAGLFVAVPAVMFYNYFTKKLKRTIPFFEEAILESVQFLTSSNDNKNA